MKHKQKDPKDLRAPRLVSLREAARLLAVSYWTLRNLIHNGEIPHVRIGRRLLIDQRDITDFIESRKIRHDNYHHRGLR